MRLLIALMIVFAGTIASAEITNYQTEGNLESPNPAGCVDIDRISNRQNPADILHGVSECIDKRKYVLASRLYLLAMAYGRYDTLRVEDKTAHQAISVLRMNMFSQFGESRIDAFQETLNSILRDKKDYCRPIMKTGKPEYYPRYMIQHGMGAFLGNQAEDGLIPDFQPESSWREIASEMGCLE